VPLKIVLDSSCGGGPVVSGFLALVLLSRGHSGVPTALLQRRLPSGCRIVCAVFLATALIMLVSTLQTFPMHLIYDDELLSISRLALDIRLRFLLLLRLIQLLRQ